MMRPSRRKSDSIGLMSEQIEWRNVKTWAKKELIKCRNKNESDLDKEETAKVRGEIKILRKLLALDKEPLKPEEVPNIGYID